MHFLLVGSQLDYVVRFRGALLASIAARGHRVTAMAPPGSAEDVRRLEAMGIAFRPISLQRNGLNPFADAASLAALRRAIAEAAPDMVLAYAIKPIIWSGLALLTFPRDKVRFFALVTGLGYAFEGKGFVRGGLKALVSRLYRLALSRAAGVVFQNRDNRDQFIARGIAAADKCHVVNGSGVDIRHYDATPLPATSALHLLLVARLLGDKGLREYAAAAEIVRRRHPEVVFNLVGPADPSPDGIPPATVEAWQRQGLVAYHGATTDVRPHIAAAHVFVLPSYHEGMPRSVLEAMAMGRPILTTDVPGCRDTVVPGVNGWLVPKADAAALAERIEWFIANRQRWAGMGEASRRMALERFDVEAVNADMRRIMGLADTDPRAGFVAGGTTAGAV